MPKSEYSDFGERQKPNEMVSHFTSVRISDIRAVRTKDVCSNVRYPNFSTKLDHFIQRKIYNPKSQNGLA